MRDAELFARIEYLMQTEGVYRQNDLTIERLAERLDTNRTYISRAINQQAGKAFSSYVNSYRIDEAVRRLSAEGACPDARLQPPANFLYFVPECDRHAVV